MSENNSMVSSTATPYFNENDGYEQFMASVKNRFNRLIGDGIPLFTTDAENLFDLLLDNLPPEARQHYTCRSCDNFVSRFGGLVTMTETGEMVSVLWDEGNTPSFFQSAVSAIKKAVLKARVNGVFLSESQVLGQPVTGDWEHLSTTLPKQMVFKDKLYTADQIMAEKLQDREMLIRVLLEYKLPVIEQAVVLLKTESLDRPEKTVTNAEWFQALQSKFSAERNSRNKENLVWLAAATAPTGFTHINGGMLGTLLEDIKSGLSFESIKRKFGSKMDPTKYQRPQSPPPAGNIQEAEKIVEKLGIKNSLVRRFARLDEIEKIWVPRDSQKQPQNVQGGSVFGHLLAQEKEQPKLNVPAVNMTWEKFQKTVLPLALGIEFAVRSGANSYSAILTAAFDDAPPILQWDSEEKRNPFSTYVYAQGSQPSNWGLTTGYRKVTAISFKPPMWGGENFDHQGKGVIFILDGAKDERYEGAGNALFPETLKKELHGIRATIELFSKKAVIQGFEEASACGISLQPGSNANWNYEFRVTTATGTMNYKLDRWD
jgi:hypothetical protein